MQKLIIVSDIHANLSAMQAFVKNLDMEHDKIINCGDLIGYYAHPNECLKIAQELNMDSVIGEHEYALLNNDISFMNNFSRDALRYAKSVISKENIDYIKTFQDNIRFEFEGKKFYVSHSAPGFPIWKSVPPGTSANIYNEMFEKVNSDIIIMGHTHQPFVHRFKNGLIINPGSAGQPRDSNPRPSYIELNVEDEKVNVEIKRFTYDIEETRKSVFMQGLPNFLSERLYMGV
ncbi:MAG: metallophosphoesterase family protein [Candidatus Nanoarchaeia archaeon]|nr:metallophosphoesterase family protein [Candidatus Nanoarchaeia archaeon]